MGAPYGNCNACKSGSHKRNKSTGIKTWRGGKLIGYNKMKAKGWYKRSAGRAVLKTIKRLAWD
jgi:hypothetical protein